MSLSCLMQVLLDYSAKAASLARTIREDETLFALLVEEKTGDSKNVRFTQDFKTLSDVLIQQALCSLIDKQFPALRGRVYGEEQAVFSNTVGEQITVAVQSNEEATAALLAQVLNGNNTAAAALAHEVHRSDVTSGVSVSSALPALPLENLAIWIDPIDSTAEYIKGDDKQANHAGRGLQCVTVLLGVFDTTDGRPVAGVVHQPFAAPPPACRGGDSPLRGPVLWGVCGDTNNLLSSSDLQARLSDVALERVSVSSSEKEEILQCLTAAGVQTVPAAGAGYKALIVIDDQVQAYVCSKPSTYMWDTCAPHAILISIGGGVIPYTSLELFSRDPAPDASLHQLKYVEATHPGGDISPYCNAGGVVAYRSFACLVALAKILFPNSDSQ
ncbi:Inositol monophosphatase-like [Trinorchestia longiramus]|nr:Inositol monophosphatase-like [Trinorchestia longiramus]